MRHRRSEAAKRFHSRAERTQGQLQFRETATKSEQWHSASWPPSFNSHRRHLRRSPPERLPRRATTARLALPLCLTRSNLLRPSSLCRPENRLAPPDAKTGERWFANKPKLYLPTTPQPRKARQRRAWNFRPRSAK